MYESIQNPPMTLPAYRALIRDWEVFPVREKSEIVGAVIRVGTELHVGWKSQPAGSRRGLIRAVLLDTISRYGMARTKVRAFNLDGLEFCRRLGFVISHQVGDIIYLSCNEARHG